MIAWLAALALTTAASEPSPTASTEGAWIRPLERDRYPITGRMKDENDVAPCAPEYVLAQRGAEVVTLVRLTMGEPSVARLP